MSSAKNIFMIIGIVVGALAVLAAVAAVLYRFTSIGRRPKVSYFSYEAEPEFIG